MQRYHRIRHRYMWLILVPLALALFTYALVHRVKFPVMDEVPGMVEEGVEE